MYDAAHFSPQKGESGAGQCKLVQKRQYGRLVSGSKCWYQTRLTAAVLDVSQHVVTYGAAGRCVIAHCSLFVSRVVLPPPPPPAKGGGGGAWGGGW